MTKKKNTTETPDLSKKIEDWSKAKEKAWEEKTKQVEKRGEHVANIVINLLLIYVFGQLQNWLSFLTESFSTVLTLFYISFAATILVNIVFLIYRNRIFIGIGKAALNLWSLVVLVSLYYVFPFDFSAYSFNAELAVKVLIALAMVGTVIGILHEIIGLLVTKKSDKKHKE